MRLIMILLYCILKLSSCYAQEDFKASIEPIPKEIEKKMIGKSWHQGCPVDLSDLSYLTLRYLGFDNKVHEGNLIVHHLVADDVVSIFQDLFKIKYQIEKIILREDLQEDLDSSNFTSAFACRQDAQSPNQISMHSYGLAMDINRFYNPGKDGKNAIPKEGKKYLDRNLNSPHMIKEGDPVFTIFTNHGWRWGGFFNQPDYMHFDKGTSIHNQYMIQKFEYLPPTKRFKNLPD